MICKVKSSSNENWFQNFPGFESLLRNGGKKFYNLVPLLKYFVLTYFHAFNIIFAIRATLRSR